MDHILKGDFFRFPYNLGILKIRKNKVNVSNKKYMRIDFNATKKEGKTIYHLNEHSDGYYYRFKWKKGYVSNIFSYVFTPVRSRKRELAQTIKSGFTEYGK